MKNNTLYKLLGHSPRCGFFCMFSNVCSYLYNENDNVFIHWGENRFTKGDENALDFIFKQEYPKEYDTITGNVNMWGGNVKKYFTANPSSNPSNIEEFNRLFWSRFSINKKLNDRIENLKLIKGEKRTLSVHIRRGDILSETYFLPYLKFDINDLEKYYEKINNHFISGNYEKIFLCSEDQTIIDFLKNKFDPDVIFFQEVSRVSNEVAKNNSSIEPLYETDGETLLLEIMSDVLFAKECEGFLGTTFSGVSIFIEVFNNNKFESINYF